MNANEKTIYTIVYSFSLSEYNEPPECWIAHYANREDAIRAFAFKLKECNTLNENGEVPVDEENKTYISVEKLFDNMALNGYAYDTYSNGTTDHWFIRAQPLQTTYDEEFIAFD